MGIIRRTRVVKMSSSSDPDFAPIWDKICRDAVLGADKSYIASTGEGGARSLQYRTSGKWHFEINLGTGGTQSAMVGISYGTPWEGTSTVWGNVANTCPIYGYSTYRISYTYGRLTRLSGNMSTAGFGNNVVVGFDLDADMNTLRVRTTTQEELLVRRPGVAHVVHIYRRGNSCIHLGEEGLACARQAFHQELPSATRKSGDFGGSGDVAGPPKTLLPQQLCCRYHGTLPLSSIHMSRDGHHANQINRLYMGFHDDYIYMKINRIF